MSGANFELHGRYAPGESYDVRDEDRIVADDRLVVLFQQLLDNGVVWQISPEYSRIASQLLLLGHIRAK